MPRISTFYGIVVWMYHDDHAPPHVHVEYSEHKARIAIGSLRVLHGSLPPRALRMFREWGRLHRGELEENWRRARLGLAVEQITPLE